MKFLAITAITFFCTLHLTPAEGLSGYNRQIIASCMVLEAAGDGTEGMQAVLNVILNRADGYLHRMIPETVKRGAFSCMSSTWNVSRPNYSPLIRRARNQSRAYATALNLIDTMEQGLLWDNTGGATHYHTTSVRPYWVDDMHYLTTIGHHHFYSLHMQNITAL